MDTLKKKYGLFTAICMVVGIVIGSGIFFKAEDVFGAAAGNAWYSVLAWLISGLIMVAIATTFAVMATKYEKVNGAVDYAEATCGKTYAYFVGWFMSIIYYPAMTSVLAWVSARYTLVAIGYIDKPLFLLGAGAFNSSINSAETITLALVYMVLAYFINAIAPRIAGKFQISSTAVKLVPIVFIALVGAVVGLANGKLVDNFTVSSVDMDAIKNSLPESTGLFPAICGTIFAYEGWIVATAINSEIKNSKKNLPIALCVGTLIVVIAYTLYNVGILGLGNVEGITTGGTGVVYKVFGGFFYTLIHVFIVISCLGTLNGLMLGCCRGIYSLAARNEGLSPETFVQIDKKTNIPHNSCSFALMISAVWFAYFVLVGGNFFGWAGFDKYSFDSSELPIITVYPLYVPIFIVMMLKEKGLNPLKRFVLPIISILGIAVIVVASIVKHKMANVWYLVVFGIIMLVGYLVLLYNRKKATKIPAADIE